MKKVKIKLDNISVGYQIETVIEDLSIEIEEGQFTGIFGHNGAGKTTLLCAINGLARIKKGRVFINDIEFNIFTQNLLRRIIGYVPQTIDIDPKLPVLAEEVILMGRYGKLGLFHFPGEKEKKLLNEISSLLEIEHILKKPFGKLSGGERKRILIARALLKEPEILLLDEIFAYLDFRMTDKISREIKEIHKNKGVTILLVSHDLEIIKKMCERVIWMEEGKIIFDGKKEEFIKKFEAKNGIN
jgi:ABC-type Mn2+/Zn2+ transport system ATPase subunit